MSIALRGKEKRFLRALGHALDPIVHIGKAGLTTPLEQAIDLALTTHELIKVKLVPECTEDRDDAAERLAKALKAGVAQTLGRTILLYRPHPKKPRIVLPKQDDSAKDALTADRRAKAKAAKKAEIAKKTAAAPRAKSGSRAGASRSRPASRSKRG